MIISGIKCKMLNKRGTITLCPVGVQKGRRQNQNSVVFEIENVHIYTANTWEFYFINFSKIAKNFLRVRLADVPGIIVRVNEA